MPLESLVPPADGSFTRHLTRVSGLHLHWAELGEGPVVILLHGLCDSHRTWHKVAESLARSRRVLMPDLPGHGLSDRPDAAYTVDWYAEILAAWIRTLGLSSFDLVGHSFGGGVAQMLLLAPGLRVERLALVAPGGLGKEVSLGLRLWSAANPSERLTQPLIASSTRLGMSTLLPDAAPEEVAYLSWLNAMPGTARSLSRTVSRAIDWRGQKQSFFERSHELSAFPRIQLFWGDRDPIVPVLHAEEMLARLPGVTLVRFAKCGHFPHQEYANAFAAALDEFLATSTAVPAVPQLPEHVVELAQSHPLAEEPLSPPEKPLVPAPIVVVPIEPATRWRAFAAWVVAWVVALFAPRVKRARSLEASKTDST